MGSEGESSIAVFVSEDERLLEKFLGEVDLVVSDRSVLKDIASDKFFDLDHDEADVLELLESKGVSTGVCLGYRRLFSGSFLEEVSCEMFNLHPSLLPAFKGLDVYKRVIERGLEVSGATLHKVSEEMDEGEIIDQISYRIPEDIESGDELRRFAKSYEQELFRRNFLEN